MMSVRARSQFRGVPPRTFLGSCVDYMREYPRLVSVNFAPHAPVGIQSSVGGGGDGPDQVDCFTWVRVGSVFVSLCCSNFKPRDVTSALQA